LFFFLFAYWFLAGGGGHIKDITGFLNLGGPPKNGGFFPEKIVFSFSLFSFLFFSRVVGFFVGGKGGKRILFKGGGGKKKKNGWGHFLKKRFSFIFFFVGPCNPFSKKTRFLFFPKHTPLFF